MMFQNTIRVPVAGDPSSVFDTSDKDATILLVDDVPANIETLFTFLQDQGFRVLVAEDGRSALHKAAYAMPDIILLDVLMPGIDGFETCQQLKENHQTKDIPVIFMTALSDTPFSMRGFELGAVDYITKPIRQEEVLIRILAHLSSRRYYLALQAKNAELKKTNMALASEIEQRKQAEISLEMANDNLLKTAVLDELTEIANRRIFDEQLDKEWHRMSRESSPLSLIRYDVDCFEAYHDSYGAEASNQCLKKVAQSINQAAKRRHDLVARYTHKEFAMLIPGIANGGVTTLARRALSNVQALRIEHKESACEIITLSVGLATMIPAYQQTPDNLIAYAGDALAEAQSKGCNCIVQKQM